jgi:hypothetical protein
MLAMSKEKSIQSKGGLARKDALSPERRRQIARQAAAGRWKDKPIRATHKGNFKDDFGIDVECYVLDDETKTAVISQRGMGAALKLGDSSGRAFPTFIGGKIISEVVGAELLEKIANPLIFLQPKLGGTSPPPDAVYGYDVTILIDVCKAIATAEADGKLLKSQANIARQAHVILNASAKAGIKGLVYALAGYSPAIEEVIAAFKQFVRDEARGI